MGSPGDGVPDGDRVPESSVHDVPPAEYIYETTQEHLLRHNYPAMVKTCSRCLYWKTMLGGQRAAHTRALALVFK